MGIFLTLKPLSPYPSLMNRAGDGILPKNRSIVVVRRDLWRFPAKESPVLLQEMTSCRCAPILLWPCSHLLPGNI